MLTVTSEGGYVEVDGGFVGELERLLRAAGGSADYSDALSDVVLDCCEATVARRLNGEDADRDADQVYEETAQIGCDVNNGGVPSQLAFLIAELGADATRTLVDGVAGA